MDVKPLPLCHNFAYEPQMVVEGQDRFGPMPITACNVMDTPNLRRYGASLEAVLLLSKTSNHGTYRL